MTLTKYTVFMLIITLFCWGAWVLVIFQIDPTAAGALGFIVFYVTLFFALTASLAVVGLLLRRWFVSHQPPTRQVAIALRQGVWFALLLVGALVLLSWQLLTVWNTLLLIAVLTVVEFFFISTEHNGEQSV
ncbi:hypothetical protein HY933_00830 [Candidatus Falkowbacteria bacterium]|nr:hypothetical protein [Candidatus Falkowbacteria bacterium]